MIREVNLDARLLENVNEVDCRKLGAGLGNGVEALMVGTVVD